MAEPNTSIFVSISTRFVGAAIFCHVLHCPYAELYKRSPSVTSSFTPHLYSSPTQNLVKAVRCDHHYELVVLPREVVYNF